MRSSPAFLASALSSDKARFLVYDNLNPLVKVTHTDGAKTLQTVKWDVVKALIVGEDGDAKAVFDGVDGKDNEKLGVIPSHWRKAGDVAELSSEDKRAFFINVSLSPPIEPRRMSLTHLGESSKLPWSSLV